jgi:hypothetical protein
LEQTSKKARGIFNMAYIVKEKTREELLEKFEKNFIKTDGCWEWQGKMFSNSGYGYFYMGKGWQGGSHGVRTMRAAYALYIDRNIPEKIHVCHSCDNPKCVNPAHLWLGTNEENMQDMFKKGRNVRGHGEVVKVAVPRGGNHYKSHLNDQDILDIIELRKSGLTLSEISAIYKINVPGVHKICQGKRWAHVQREVI